MEAISKVLPWAPVSPAGSNDLQQKVGQAIRQLRRQRGMSQQVLAVKADVARTYLSAVESGDRNVTLKTLSRFAEALEVSVAVFFDRAGNGV